MVWCKLDGLSSSRLRSPEKPCQWGSRQETQCLQGPLISPGLWRSVPINLGAIPASERSLKPLNHAEKSRAPIQKTADRLAGYLVYFALGAAILTFLFTHNFWS